MEAIPSKLTDPVVDGDHVKGHPSAAVTIVEYGDYQCPFCKAAEPLVDALASALGAQLRIVFRHFPVSSVHPLAERAAEAAESAGAQGRFWEMHRLLFANQEFLEAGAFSGYAGRLGLDVTRFEADLESHAHRRHVRDNLQGGLRSGVRGTPTFFIDGVRYTAYPNLLGILGDISAAHPTLEVALDPTVGNISVSNTTRHG